MSLLQAKAGSPMAPSPPHQSPWHTPVPYLFGGLAAMLSLIAFALLILACSFSKNREDGHGDLEAAGDSKPNNHTMDLSPVLEDKYLVIMAGQAKPTFLATPVSSRASSFGTCSCSSHKSFKNSKEKHHLQLQVPTMENQETTDQVP